MVYYISIIFFFKVGKLFFSCQNSYLNFNLDSLVTNFDDIPIDMSQAVGYF